MTSSPSPETAPDAAGIDDASIDDQRRNTERQRILLTPRINATAVTYQVMAVAATMLASIFLIPLMPIILPCVYLYQRRYYANLKVVLTARDLQIDRGVLVREEKRIPLEKITDLATFQGPIMRYFGLRGLRVETAGQAGGAGNALVRIIGLDDTVSFRERVLIQRDRIADRDDPTPSDTSQTAVTATATELRLTEIRDCLQRIEKHLSRPAS